MFRHGLRTAELVALKWTQIDLVGGYIEVRRAKHGHDSIHPLRSPELRALRQLQRDYPDTQYVFVSERKAPLSTRSVRHIIARAGELADLPFKVHPHQLRHACGYYLAAQGQGVVKSSWWMSDRYNTERLGNYVIMIINRRFAKNRPTNH
jgi:type 1 fimbriae regulatory protein FimB/type 1 fimbriae regulatory protein FimE